MTIIPGQSRISIKDFAKERIGSISSDYIFMKTLGKGGYGEVIKARHKTLNIYRAIKIIKKDQKSIQ